MAPTIQSTLSPNYKVPNEILLSDHHNLTMWLGQEDHYLSPLLYDNNNYNMGEIDDLVVPNLYDYCSINYDQLHGALPMFNNIYNDFTSGGYEGLGECNSYGVGCSQLFDNGEDHQGYLRSTYGDYVQAHNNINVATNVQESWGFEGQMSNPTSEDQNNNVKVGKYSVEERRDRILRYLKKRNQRNFSKTIKYACRKTLADRRVRVRGRFAKNREEEHAHANNTLMTSEEESLSLQYMNNNKNEQYYDEEWLQEAMSSLMYLPHTPVWHGESCS